MKSPEQLFGRRNEQSALVAALEAARRGAVSAVIVAGPPGIGKTALLRWAEEQAGDFDVVAAPGVRATSAWPYAALHLLLARLSSHIPALASNHRALLRDLLATGPAAGPRPEGRAAAVAVAALLVESSGERPLLILADDLHRWDAESLRCLSFAARLAAGARLAVLGSTRDPRLARDPYTPHELAALTDDDARELVGVLDPTLTTLQTDRVLRLSGGNPRALREFTAVADRLGGPARAEPVPVTDGLRALVRAGMESVPAESRRLLLLAALADGLAAEVVRRAAAMLGIGSTAWDYVMDRGLLDCADGRVRLRDPLLAAVGPEIAPVRERREIHRALVTALPPDDEERRIRQLAGAAAGADESVATRLEQAGQRARADGRHLDGARLLRRAALLSESVSAAGIRIVRAARAAWDAGDIESARAFLAEAAEISPEAVTGEGASVAALVEFTQGDCRRATDIMRAGPAGPMSAADRELGRIAWVVDWATGAPGLPGDHALPPHSWDPARARDWLTIPVPLIIAEGHAGDLRRSWERLARDPMMRGEIGWHTALLARLAALEAVTGHPIEAAANARAALPSARAHELPHSVALCLNTLAWLAGIGGDEAEADRLSSEALEFARQRALPSLIAWVYWTRGLTALSAGKPAAALDLLEATATPGHEAEHPTLAILAAPDAIEAAVQLGRDDAARAHLDRLTAWAEHGGAPWAVATAACGRALLGPGDAAEAEFAAAVAAVDPSVNPFLAARIRLLQGNWLRRARRPLDARAPLHAAREGFELLGAHPWARRAAAELEMAGDQPAATDDLLTTQERRVAELAAEGMTNREIGAHLFISHRTAAHHLSSVFRKLGLTTRDQLAGIDLDGDLRLRP